MSLLKCSPLSAGPPSEDLPMSDEQRSARLGDHDISKDQSEQLRARELDDVFCEHVGQLPAKAWAALLLNNAAANPQTLANILSPARRRCAGARPRRRRCAGPRRAIGVERGVERILRQSQPCSRRHRGFGRGHQQHRRRTTVVCSRARHGRHGPADGRGDAGLQAAPTGRKSAPFSGPPFNPSWSEGVMKRRAIVALCVVLMTVHVPSGGAERWSSSGSTILVRGSSPPPLWLTVITCTSVLRNRGPGGSSTGPCVHVGRGACLESNEHHHPARHEPAAAHLRREWSVRLVAVASSRGVGQR